MSEGVRSGVDVAFGSGIGHPADWPVPPGVRTWQTTRGGGVSRGSYASLNLGLHVGDQAECVEENRRRLRVGLELPGEPVWLEQVHGDRVVSLDQSRDAGSSSGRDIGPADGAVTARLGVICAVMTADCLPVLLADRGGAQVGVAHAGWRGLASGVLAAAVARFGSEPADLQAWLGPAISQPAFEVGSEVRDAFLAKDASTAGAFVDNARGRWQADLYRLARLELRRAGVHAIYGRECCTHGDANQYFSHRREAPCGRMATLIWRIE